MKISDPTTIRRFRSIRPVLDFSFSPEGTPVTWGIGVYTFAPVNTFAVEAGIELTFTATATMPPRLSPGSAYQDEPPNAEVVEYYWTFGDGHFGYGNPVAHSYNIANGTTPVTLRVTDDQGRQYSINKQMYVKRPSLFPSDALFPSDSLFPGA